MLENIETVLDSLITYILRHVSLSETEKNIIRDRVLIRNYLKGQFVVQQGDICRHESFVKSGCLKKFHIDKHGNEHIIMFAVEDWWTSDLGSFIDQTPANYNVQCLENCTLIQISKDTIEGLYQDIPILERFFRIIIQRAYVASDNRIIRNFSLSAKERYLHFQQQYPNIEQRVPQYLIASYLGITKEFLSKIRHQLMLDQ